MDFVIRKAVLDDATAIAHVQVKTWKTTYAGIVPDGFLNSMSDEAQAQRWQTQLADDAALILVAEDKSGIFGFACGGEIREALGDYDAEIYAIYLLQQRQKQGVGRMLSQTLASGLRARDFKSMVVWVLEANPSISFYKRLGGIQVARKQIQIGDADLPELAFGWPVLDELIEAG